MTALHITERLDSLPISDTTSTAVSDGFESPHGNVLRVQKLLRAEYPDEHHANCDVWAIWQMKVGSEIGGEGK